MSIGRTHLRDLGRPEEREEPLAPNYVEERLGRMIDPDAPRGGDSPTYRRLAAARYCGERGPELFLADPKAAYRLEATVKGRALTQEMRIIGALVRRLGGTVELTAEELLAVQGVVLDSNGDSCHITAGNGYSEE